MSQFRLQILIDHAEEKSRQAGQELRRIRIRWTQEEQKKSQLQEYLQDYRVRLNQTALSGMSVALMMDFHRFISKLEFAISSQNQEILRCQKQWEAAQKIWLEREQELKAYAVLKMRHEQAEMTKEQRKDQKLLDEFAQNGHLRRLRESSSH